MVIFPRFAFLEATPATGPVVKTSLVAAAAVTVKGALVAEARPVLVAESLKSWPDLSMESPGKVATPPALVDAVRTPVRVPTPELIASDIW
jgi:hypothetical protein